MNTNDFKCVEFQRERRAKLSDEYNTDPDYFKKELKKYRIEKESAETVQPADKSGV